MGNLAKNQIKGKFFKRNEKDIDAERHTLKETQRHT